MITAWQRLAYPVSIIVIAGHLAKALEKLASWIGFLPLALRDPEGAATATGITDGTLAAPGSWLPPLALYAAGLVFLVLAVRIICREAALRSPEPVSHP